MNKCATRQTDRGSSMIELAICLPVLMLLGLGTVQGGLLYHAKTTVNYATFEAARKGAVTHAQKSPMRRELGIRLAPVFGGSGDPEDALKSLMSAAIDAQDQRFTKLEILNPTTEAFDEWGIDNLESGKREIPNDHLRQRHSDRVVKARSGVNLQDANLLKIKVTYGYKMTVPLVDKLFARTMLRLDPGNAGFYRARRIPITSAATVRMQSPAWKDDNAIVIASIVNNQATPTSLVTPVANIDRVPCDAHGVRENISGDVLHNLMTVDASTDACVVPSATISSLSGSVGTASSLIGDQISAVNPSGLTDCTP